MAPTNLIGAHCFVRHRAIESNAAGGGYSNHLVLYYIINIQCGWSVDHKIDIQVPTSFKKQ